MVASCQPPLACKGKNKSIDTIAILITPRADCGAEGRCSGEGMVPHSSGCAPAGKAGALQPGVGCSQDGGISTEIIPALRRNIPSRALQLFPLRTQAWGNPCLTPSLARVRNGLSPAAGPWAELPRLVPGTFPPGSPARGRKARVCDDRRRRPRSGPAPCAALPPQTCLSTSSAGTNLPYVSANRGNCWNQCLIGFRLWQTACRYIFLCQSRRGRRGARELGDAEWK